MYITIDIGGSNIRVSQFKDMENPMIGEVGKISMTNNYDQDIAGIFSLIDNLHADTVQGIGIAIAGVLDDEKNFLIVGPNTSGWANQPLKQTLQDKYKCDVVMESDSVTNALGEATYGLNDTNEFLLAIWGTGIGGTLIRKLEGKTLLYQCEWGHQIIQNEGRQCTCGQKGCLEAYCGGKQMASIYGKSADMLTEDEWTEVLRNMAQGLINVAAMHQLKLIVFSGGIAINQRKHLDQLHFMIQDKMKIFPAPVIKVSDFDENLGLYGGLALLKNHFNNNSYS